MPAGDHARRERDRAVVLVRNAVDHDARVLREARTLARLGLRVTVVGVVSFTETRETSDEDGIAIRRIGPSSRLGWAIYREISRLRPARSADRGAPEPAAGAPARRTAAIRAGRVPARAGARRLLRWGSTVAYYVRAIREALRLRPDLVHCNDYNTMWIGVACRLMLGSAVVYDSHELWPDRNLRPEWRPWLLLSEFLFVRVADRVVMTSPAHAEVMARRYRVPEPIVVRNIPEREAGAGVEGSAAEPERLVVYVGGLQPNRGIEQAIRALALLDDVRLRLLGPGAPTYRATLRELVRSLGVGELVEFAEPVPPDAVVEAVAGAGAGLALFEPVCLSHRLVLPNKLFEYARAGVPILGSDLPMIARFIEEHRIGMTVDPEDVLAIARAIDAMLEPERNRALRAAAASAREALDPEGELDLLRGVYRDVLGARRGRLTAA